MIKNLIYGALGAGAAAAAATALVMATANSEPPTSCTVTLDANGGEFTTLETNVYVRTVSYSNKFGTVFNEETAVTNYNYRLTAWTNATGVVSNDSPVLSDMTCYAQWERLPIQRFDLVNGEFNGSDEEGINHVAQFPAAFYGTATITETNGHVICFTSPTSGTFRVSFDPQIGWNRICVAITIMHDEATLASHDFGKLITKGTHVPVSFDDFEFTFEKGKSYKITLKFTTGISAWGDIQAHYIFGIGLGGHHIKFDAGEYGTTSYYDSNFRNDGANLTTNLPYGYLPSVSTVNSSVSFLGWFSAKKGGVQLTKTMLVGTNDIYYAHYKLPTYNYYVTFAKSGFDNQIGMVQGYQMPKQTFTSGVAQSLSNNRYYLYQHKFVGWATEPNSTTVTYTDGQSVTDIWDIPEGTCPLYAVWKETPGENHFTVSKVITNFTDVAVSTNVTTFVAVPGSIPNFSMTVTNMTPATLRVSLDPAAGSKRTGAKLCIDRLYAGTWSNSVCTVSDLSTNAVYYTFSAAEYRFRVTGGNTSYSYSVGIGAKGARIDFDPCCEGYVNASTLSSSLTFDWTTDSPYGYLPPLTSSKYGTHLGWFYNKDVTDTNAVTEANVVASNATLYAHWANQPYYIAFQGNGATSPTNAYTQEFCYGTAKALTRNQYYRNDYRFDGWTNAAGKAYADCEVVSNLCTIAGGTNALYAVWDPTPGTNWYYVGGVMTNFQNISISQGSPTHFIGTGDSTQFFVSSTATNRCRVAIDPVLGFGRTNAALTVSCRQTDTNTWEEVCSVTDLQEKETTCSFKSGWQYKFVVTLPSNAQSYQYDVTLGAEGARYIFDVCGGNFVGEEETTKVKFYNWTVGSGIAYTPSVTTNKWVGGTNTWHYTPQYLTVAEMKEQGIKFFSVTNLIVSGGEKVYAHWSDAVIVDLIFDWNLSATNVVFTNYYGQGATVKLYDDDYVRQPTYDTLGFLGWTTNRTSTLGYDLKTFVVTTNSVKYYYAQWTDDWKTSRTSDGEGLSIDGYFGTMGDTLTIPKRVNTIGDVEWPVNVTAIGDSAFTNATFSALSLPETLTRIGDSAFMGCANFKTLEIPATVAYVGVSAFEDCTSLKTVTYPSIEVTDEYATSGFLDGIFEDGTPSVELCECLFKGCTSLTSVELPLGVNCIPDECFSGCLSLTSFTNMPYTVITIGAKAFYGCTHLTNIDHTEIVGEIGAYAYRKCARLKFLNFIGDNPESVESDILSGTPRNVLVRYLENMCSTAKDYCGGSWPSLPSLWPEAGATNTSRTLTWLGGRHPRRKVIFNYNNNDVIWKSTQVPALYHSGRVFGLLAPTEDEMNSANGVTASSNDDDDEEGEEEEEEEEELTGFSGWYTQPMGGRKIGSYWVVPTATDGDSAPITVYAHWGDEEGEGEETGSRSYGVYYGHDENTDDFETFTGFYTVETEDEDGEILTEGDESFYYAASTFNGIVIDLNNENAVTGTVSFVFEDGTYPTDGGMQSKFKATVTWNTGKTTTFSGVADAEGYLVSSSSKWSLGEEGEDHRTVVTKSGINGWLSNGEDEFRIYAARDRYSATEGSAWTIVQKDLQATRGTWHVVLANETPEPVEGYEGEVDFTGYSTFAITIAGMGKATITGTLGDGTKVSTTSTLIVGDGCACLPVNIRPYSGKGGFSFLLWFTWQSDGSFDVDDVTIQGLTDWTAPTFTAKLSTVHPLTFIDEKRYSGEAEFNAESEATATLLMSNTVWKVSDRGENNVRITYDASTGIFTGSFTVTGDDEKSTTAKVSGVFTDLITTDGDEVTEVYHGYGTAVIKGERSIPVEIKTLDD